MLLTLNMLPVSSSDHCDENVLRSPCKGAVLPKSTSSAVSPLVRRSLGSLPSSLSLPTSNSPHAKRQLISPQITKWFRKSTPRKLAVTPKKTSASVREEKSSVTRVKRKLCAEPDVGDNQGVTELAVKLDVGQPSRENDPKLSPSKRQRTEPCSAVNVLSPVDSNCDKQSEQMPDKTLRDTSLSSHTCKLSATTTDDTATAVFHSPTVNLPNYVYNPQPRVPIGRHLSPAKRRPSRDWLTQLRLERQNSSVQRNPPFPSPQTRSGQTRHKTTKVLKSSPHVSHSAESAVEASSPASKTDDAVSSSY